MFNIIYIYIYIYIYMFTSLYDKPTYLDRFVFEM